MFGICEVCGIKYSFKYRGKKRKFCSNVCRGKYLSGKKRPEHSKLMFGLGNSNYKNPEDRITPLTFQIRTCLKMLEWRAQIYARDNYTCRYCGIYGTILNAHHIKKFSDILKECNIKTIEDAYNCYELWNTDNGITYCKKCHDLLNHKDGLLNE